MDQKLNRCPTSLPDQFLGFDTSVGLTALDEACVRLGVRRAGSPLVSFTRRAIGSRVFNPLSKPCWVKVTALVDSDSNWLRSGETEAVSIREVPKPDLLRIVDWTCGDLNYRAVLMSLAPSPCVEFGPLAGKAAPQVGDAWIDSLRQAVGKLRTVETTRHRIAPDSIASRIHPWLGPDVPLEVDDWHTAHGDLNWGNLTWPNLHVLDWETWGLAPQGFDLAYLVAYSCADPQLCTRLQAAFAPELGTRSARVALLLALAELTSNVHQGWFPETWRPPAEQMAARVAGEL